MNPLVQTKLVLVIALLTCVPESTPHRLSKEDFHRHFDRLTASYAEVQHTRECSKLRYYAESAYRAALSYEILAAASWGNSDKCPMVEESAGMMYNIGRLICIFRNEFTSEERQGVFFLGTMYAVGLYVTCALICVICTLLCKIVQFVFGKPERQTTTKSNTRPLVHPTTHAKLYPTLGSAARPPAYEKV